MKKDIILSGVGGQGILSIATIIGYTAVENNMRLKQAEVHGMSQRGGDVQSHLRISDSKIYSDLVPEGKADLIIAVEPMEALRYLPYLSEEGWLITNTKPFENIPNYPDIDSVISTIEALPRKITLDADAIARETGNPRCMNMVMIGAASSFLSLPDERLKESIRVIFERKGEDIVAMNIKAFEAGKIAAAK